MDAPNNFVEVPTTSWHMSCATEFRSEVFDKAVLKHQKKKKKKKKNAISLQCSLEKERRRI